MHRLWIWWYLFNRWITFDVSVICVVYDIVRSYAIIRVILEPSEKKNNNNAENKEFEKEERKLCAVSIEQASLNGTKCAADVRNHVRFTRRYGHLARGDSREASRIGFGIIRRWVMRCCDSVAWIHLPETLSAITHIRTHVYLHPLSVIVRLKCFKGNFLPCGVSAIRVASSQQLK